MEKKLASTIKYFAVFDYFPNFEDIYTFFPEKIDKKALKTAFESNKYTPPQYSIERKISNIKYQISKKKLNNWRYKAYISLLSLFPQIKLVGLSGSISMMNASEEDDIDLFIITAKNRLFTGRFIAMVLAQILGIRRTRNLMLNKAQVSVFSTASPQRGPRRLSQKQKPSLLQNNYKNKVCLNLFFDENDLKVPKFKQTEFVGHEILQMKPIIDKDQTYERFLEVNGWVFKLFPNGKSKSEIRNPKSEVIFKFENFQNSNLFRVLNFVFRIFSIDWLENLFKNFQLSLINRHRTTEIVTPSQLWFHPDDFEKKIRV